MTTMTLKLIFIFLVGAIAYAQPENSDTTKTQSKKALLFSIDEFRLASFNGGIGMKYSTSTGNAFIGKIIVSYSSSEIKPTEYLNGSKETKEGFGVLFGIEKHFAIDNALSPYIGISVSFGLERKDDNIYSANSLMGIYDTKKRKDMKLYSLTMSFGLEYFVRENISLAGQYNLGILKKTGVEEFTTTFSKTTMNSSELQAGVSSGGLTLSVYF